MDAARPEERAAAFELAFRRWPERERPLRVVNALALAASGEIDPQGILIERCGERIVGVQVAAPLPGSSGLLWLPEIADDAPDELASELARAGLAWLRGRGMKVAQAILGEADLPLAGPLFAAGMKHVGRLRYSRHDLAALPDLPMLPQLDLRSLRDLAPEQFARILQRTYEGTRDFPELNDVRTIDEIVEGHRRAGVFRPEHWLSATWDGSPAGVVILTEVPGGAWDLSYLGVAPEYRRRGVGVRLAHAALRIAQTAGCLELWVGADERNAAALQLYRSLGFEEGPAREVLLMFFGENAHRTAAR